MEVLKVFIVQGCLGCKRALELADWLRGINPKLVVEIIDLALSPNAGQLKTWLDKINRDD